VKIGILGVGHLAAYLVQGAQGVEFVLSPGSGEKAAGLAAGLAARQGCVVAQSNQAVVDLCDMVLGCLPAAGGRAVLRGISVGGGLGGQVSTNPPSCSRNATTCSIPLPWRSCAST